MEKSIVPLLILALVMAVMIGAGLGYFVGYDHGAKETPQAITSFEDCWDAGYPIMESYPEQCRTPDGQTFVREIPAENPEEPVTSEPERPLPTEPVACTMEAKMCPDGSAVGRTGPNCEFAPCPQ